MLKEAQKLVYDDKYSKGPSVKLVFADTGKNIDVHVSIQILILTINFY